MKVLNRITTFDDVFVDAEAHRHHHVNPTLLSQIQCEDAVGIMRSSVRDTNNLKTLIFSLKLKILLVFTRRSELSKLFLHYFIYYLHACPFYF